MDINEVNKKMMNKINDLRNYAFSTKNMNERAKRLAKVEGYHAAYIDMIFALGMEKEFFRESVV